MTSHFWNSLAFGALAASANILGGLIVVKREWSRKYLNYFVALGAGFMLATATLEMLPESFRLFDYAPILILGGYLLVHFFEHTVTPHFHFGEETHPSEHLNPMVGYSSLLGLLIHTFFDGVSIASGFAISQPLGLLIFLAIFLHKLPEGFTISSIMLSAGRTKSFALLCAALLALTTLAGVLTISVARHLVKFGLPITVGVAIYVAASDLIPEVNKEPGIKMALIVFGGVVLFLAARTLVSGSF